MTTVSCMFCGGCATPDTDSPRPEAVLCGACKRAFRDAMRLIHQKERAGRRSGGADPHTPAREDAARPAQSGGYQDEQGST